MNKKILALQFESEIGNIQANIEKMKSLLIKHLKQDSPDFVFLPEVWTCGWDCESFPDCAEKIEDSKSINLDTIDKLIAENFNILTIEELVSTAVIDNTNIIINADEVESNVYIWQEERRVYWNLHTSESDDAIIVCESSITGVPEPINGFVAKNYRYGKIYVTIFRREQTDQ